MNSNRLFRCSAACLLSLALVLTSVLAVPGQAFAMDESDLTTVHGAAYYRSNHSDEYEDDFFYSDDLFSKSSLEFDPSLAVTSVELCAASRMSTREPDTEEGYANKVRNLRSFLEDNGFVDFECNQEYRQFSPGDYGAAVACAHKQITVGGKTYTLLALVPRSGTFGGEFKYEFLISKDENDTGNIYDFVNRKEAILNFASDYIEAKGLTGELKVWLPGYSRGAGIVNLVGGAILDDPGRLGSKVSLKPENLYCYTYGTPAAASMDQDYTNDRYKYIHNLFDSSDLVAMVPSAYMGFSKYGTNHQQSSPERKERMLAFLHDMDVKSYEKYLSSDSANYTPLKIDTKALLRGDLGFAVDKNSYLPDNLHDYEDSFCRTIMDMMARSSKSGKDPREGYYKVYQTPLMNFGEYLLGDIYNGNKGVIESITGDKRIIPFAMTMYLTFMTDKYLADRNDNLNSHLEGAFNLIASQVENEDGTLKRDYKMISSAYYSLRNQLFTEREYVEVVDDVPQKYELKYDVASITRSKSLRTKTVDLIKGLNAKMYAVIMRDALASNGYDQSVIDIMTSKEDSTAISFLLATVALGNCYQSDELKPFSLQNEQFKQLATFAGNVSSMMLEHDSFPFTSWLKTLDPYYDDYTPLTDPHKAGYRRVYIKDSNGAAVSGKVTDENGNVAATIRDGKLLSRSDEWIGITTCDNGNWLRLPLDHSYRIEVTTSKCSDITVRASDYSIPDGKVVRNTSSDSGKSWKQIRTRAVDKLTIKLPEVKVNDDGSCDFDGTTYSLSITKGKVPVKVSKNVPAASGVKAAALTKSFKVSWKKLSSAKRAKYDKTQVQYSTSKSFSSSATVSKKLAKTRTSLTVKGLKKGKTYYVRVRNINYTDDVTYVSKWSAVKKVKIK